MSAIENVRDYLGELYTITTIDHEKVIYRNLGNGFEFEVSGARSINGVYTLYVWSEKPRILVGIYKNIKGQKNLKDVLGYYAAKYQNLIEQIQVERED